MEKKKAKVVVSVLALAGPLVFSVFAVVGNLEPTAPSASEAPGPSGTVIFLDNRNGVVDGSSTYDPGTRTCGEGSYTVFTELDQAARALSAADVLYVRAGAYFRASVGKYISVHGNKVNYWTVPKKVGRKDMFPYPPIAPVLSPSATSYTYT